jgi:hypothetical protein
MRSIILALVVGLAGGETRIKVTHDGVTFEVNGERLPNGNILWSPADPFNAKSYADAKAGEEFARGRADATKNYGLEPDRMATNGESVTAKSDKAKQFYAEAQGQSESSTKLHITIIGPDEDRKAVLRDLAHHPAFSEFRGNMLIQDYAPGEWPVDAALGFSQTGKPAIIIQSGKTPSDPHGGRVLFRAEDYSIGPDAIAEAIRRADPHYNPRLDPSPSNPQTQGGCPLGFTRDHWGLLAVGAALIIVACIPRKAKP